jgi:hypothetical protein
MEKRSFYIGVAWIYEVCSEGFTPEAFVLSSYIFNQALVYEAAAGTPVPKEKLQLYILASLMIATKYHDVVWLWLDKAVTQCLNTYKRDEIETCELHVYFDLLKGHLPKIPRYPLDSVTGFTSTDPKWWRLVVLLTDQQSYVTDLNSLINTEQPPDWVIDVYEYAKTFTSTNVTLKIPDGLW